MLGSRPEYTWKQRRWSSRAGSITTAGSRRDVVCLDAATGELLWMHRKDEGVRARNAPRQLSGPRRRLLDRRQRGTHPLCHASAISWSRWTPRPACPIPASATDGVVDLKLNDDQDIDPDHRRHRPACHAHRGAQGVVIVGAAHAAGNVPRSSDNAKGYVRGFDVKTGKRLWIFHTIPRKGEFGYDTWLQPGQAEKAGNTGDWAQMSADEELGLVYLGIELPPATRCGIYRAGQQPVQRKPGRGRTSRPASATGTTS